MKNPSAAQLHGIAGAWAVEQLLSLAARAPADAARVAAAVEAGARLVACVGLSGGDAHVDLCLVTPGDGQMVSVLRSSSLPAGRVN